MNRLEQILRYQEHSS